MIQCFAFVVVVCRISLYSVQVHKPSIPVHIKEEEKMADDSLKTVTPSADQTTPKASTAIQSPIAPLVTFGTYNYSHQEILEDALGQAVYMMGRYMKRPLIDTAMKYNNLPTILKILEDDASAQIGWKVERTRNLKRLAGLDTSPDSQVGPDSSHDSVDEETEKSSRPDDENGPELEVSDRAGRKAFNRKDMYDGIAYLKANVPKARIFRILLHNYYGRSAYLEFQRLVEREFGSDMPIGICNITADQLEDLLGDPKARETAGKETTAAVGARVDWVQNEYHPFLETRVPKVCRENGIRFEAHSVMTHLDGYAEIFKKLGVPNAEVSTTTRAAQLALMYALEQGGVCFTTANFSHLKHDLETLFKPQAGEEDRVLLSAMSEFSSFERIARYKGVGALTKKSWVHICDLVQIRHEILPKLKEDIAAFQAGKQPSNLCLEIPKSWLPGGNVHGILAEMLYGEDLTGQMDKLRTKLEQKALKNKPPQTQGDADEQESGIKPIADEDLKKRLEARWNLTLHALLGKMRHRIEEAQTTQRAWAKKARNPARAVEFPEALPMDGYPAAEEFTEIIEFLKTGGAPANQGGRGLPVNVRFKHGTVNSDGRLDLCKQGFRNAFSESCEGVIQDGAKPVPVNIRFKHGTVNSDGRLDLCKQGFRNAFSECCEAVIGDNQSGVAGKSALIKHYLIGNNRIAEDGDTLGEGERRVVALVRMIKHRPDIVTWYLAGNSLDERHIRCVAEALEETRAKNIWFKMNPVKTGAYHLGKLLMRNPHIELLDLFNCGLCNQGLAAFSRGLADEAAANPAYAYSNLRHLYISINAIDSTFDLQRALDYLPKLESLFIGMNPLGDKGLREMAGIIEAASCRVALKRLNLGSMGLTDGALCHVERIVNCCPKLVSLELDSYKSTNYFDQKHNRFDVGNEATRAQLLAIARALVQNARGVASEKERGEAAMHYLGLQRALVVGPIPHARTATVAEAKALLDDFVANQLNGQTGVNVNGITGIFAKEEEKSYRHIGETKANVLRDLTAADVEQIIGGDEDVHKDLPACTGGNVKITGGGLALESGVTMEDLRAAVRHPWPAVDHIKSIYRNTMKA